MGLHCLVSVAEQPRPQGLKTWQVNDLQDAKELQQKGCLPRDALQMQDAEDLQRAIQLKVPAKIDIGPVYNVDPQRRAAFQGALVLHPGPDHTTQVWLQCAAGLPAHWREVLSVLRSFCWSGQGWARSVVSSRWSASSCSTST